MTKNREADDICYIWAVCGKSYNDNDDDDNTVNTFIFKNINFHCFCISGTSLRL